MSKNKILGLSFSTFIKIVAIIVIVLFFYGILGGPIGQAIAERATFLQPLVNSAPSWLFYPHGQTPLPELAPGTLFSIGSFPVTNTIITAWITIIILVVLTYLAFRKPKIVPAGLQKFMEFVYNSLLDFCTSVAGEKNGRRFFPFVATIFLFVITNAYLGLLPFFGDAFYVVGEGGTHVAILRSANTDINIPLALALFSWVAIETFGLKALGFRIYLKKFVNFRRLGKGFSELFHGKIGSAFANMFYGAIDVFVGFLEAVSEFIRIVSFTFRLFGNMTAGEVLILIVGFLAPLLIGSLVDVLELLIGFVQALIFGGLTLVWMTTAVAPHEEEEHN